MAIVSPEDGLVSALKAELRERGFFVRYTEWPSGHQVMLHPRGDTADVLVTEWFPTEVEAWRDALRLATAAGARAAAEPGAHQSL